MELIKAQEIRLARRDDQIVAALDLDLGGSCGRSASTPQDALRNLASEIDHR
jgi:hypothetical protein